MKMGYLRLMWKNGENIASICEGRPIFNCLYLVGFSLSSTNWDRDSEVEWIGAENGPDFSYRFKISHISTNFFKNKYVKILKIFSTARSMVYGCKNFKFRSGLKRKQYLKNNWSTIKDKNWSCSVQTVQRDSSVMCFFTIQLYLGFIKIAILISWTNFLLQGVFFQSSFLIVSRMKWPNNHLTSLFL